MELAEQLKDRFPECSAYHFSELHPGFPVLHIQNELAHAAISLYGGQILSYAPVGEQDLLWLSDIANYQTGKSIRGGIPVCWPWFGPHATDSKKPSHGFARHILWSLDDIHERSDGSTGIVLSLPMAELSAALWPNTCQLQLKLIVGEKLSLELISTNLSEKPVAITAALHSYFHISDIRNIHITGLEDAMFRDAVNANRRCEQRGVIRFNGELDRVYTETDKDILIHDPELQRVIRIHKRGSNSTVIWNPWVEKSASLGDMTENAYRSMVCVETANADSDYVTLSPGESHVLATTHSVEPLPA